MRLEGFILFFALIPSLLPCILFLKTDKNTILLHLSFYYAKLFFSTSFLKIEKKKHLSVFQLLKTVTNHALSIS